MNAKAEQTVIFLILLMVYFCGDLSEFRCGVLKFNLEINQISDQCPVYSPYGYANIEI